MKDVDKINWREKLTSGAFKNRYAIYVSLESCIQNLTTPNISR